MTVLVTGANGFVGRELCSFLRGQGYRVKECVRKSAWQSPDQVFIGDIDGQTDWDAALEGVKTVVHLAAHVHMMGRVTGAEERAFHRVNVLGSERLARRAAASGVKRLVFVSSIKVNGEATYGVPFTERDEPMPLDAYGRSKLEAERILGRVASQTGLELVTVRPPMVVGPFAKGNLALLMKMLWLGVPLPLAGMRNCRSLIGVSSLVRLLVRCMEVREAAGETFVVADVPDLSTPELIGHLSRGLGRPARLFPFPFVILQCLAAMAGRRAQLDRLSQDLQVNAAHVRKVLGWQETPSIGDVLCEAARQFARDKMREASCRS